MTTTEAIKQLKRADQILMSTAGHFEGMGLTGQSEKIDEAGHCLENVLEVLEWLEEDFAKKPATKKRGR